ncbi:MAG: hypothetical protein VX028_01320 [Nanoarchaeota archaeon]|nr:hypothetical protein [Nanoarchaeota archaeon]MEC8339717.1 hypothetical protein [Nanoarchaeota archaeon]
MKKKVLLAGLLSIYGQNAFSNEFESNEVFEIDSPIFDITYSLLGNHEIPIAKDISSEVKINTPGIRFSSQKDFKAKSSNILFTTVENPKFEKYSWKFESTSLRDYYYRPYDLNKYDLQLHYKREKVNELLPGNNYRSRTQSLTLEWEPYEIGDEFEINIGVGLRSLNINQGFNPQGNIDIPNETMVSFRLKYYPK